MTHHKIIILGDSTSMTIGAERHMYPFIMADRECWSPSTEVINCSLPGFTSADACAFYFRHGKDAESLKAVVINIGTCDSASWEIRKGRYTFLRHAVDRLKESFGIKKERTRLKNRLLHFDWNASFDPEIELSENPADYEFNLSRIVTAASKASAKVVIIRPQANRFFPPGVGKGNFVFYKYLGLNDKLSDRLSIPDRRFLEALSLQEQGRWDDAAEAYKALLLQKGELSVHYEYPLLVVNNYALCVANKGELVEAESLLMLLLKERGARKEIVLYNLAAIHRLRGDTDKYQRFMSESYESDSSMYRIRSPYLDAITRIGARFGAAVSIIDQATFVGDNLYVDHTHPLKEGQEKIADRILPLICSGDVSGTVKATISNVLYNPELANGNTTEFFTYFRTYEPFSETEIARFMAQIKQDVLNDGTETHEKQIMAKLPKELRTALGYHLTHPCFPSLSYLVHFDIRYPSDVGRFPELFLTRHLVPYVRQFEGDPVFKDWFAPDLGILRKSDDLLAILPREIRPLVSSQAPAIDHSLERLRLPAILDSCRTCLHAHSLKGNQIYERMKTTIFWYFRETLRYGSHSRITMRYSRTPLEYVAEALAVAAVIDKNLQSNRECEIRDLISHLENTVRIHDRFCGVVENGNVRQELLNEYDLQLFDAARKLNGSK